MSIVRLNRNTGLKHADTHVAPCARVRLLRALAPIAPGRVASPFWAPAVAMVVIAACGQVPGVPMASEEFEPMRRGRTVLSSEAGTLQPLATIGLNDTDYPLVDRHLVDAIGGSVCRLVITDLGADSIHAFDLRGRHVAAYSERDLGLGNEDIIATLALDGAGGINVVTVASDTTLLEFHPFTRAVTRSRRIDRPEAAGRGTVRFSSKGLPVEVWFTSRIPTDASMWPDELPAAAIRRPDGTVRLLGRVRRFSGKTFTSIFAASSPVVYGDTLWLGRIGDASILGIPLEASDRTVEIQMPLLFPLPPPRELDLGGTVQAWRPAPMTAFAVGPGVFFAALSTRPAPFARTDPQPWSRLAVVDRSTGQARLFELGGRIDVLRWAAGYLIAGLSDTSQSTRRWVAIYDFGPLAGGENHCRPHNGTSRNEQ